MTEVRMRTMKMKMTVTMQALQVDTVVTVRSDDVARVTAREPHEIGSQDKEPGVKPRLSWHSASPRATLPEERPRECGTAAPASE